MAQIEMSLEDINEKCNYLIGCDYPYYEELREAMLLLYETGARIEEIFDISRWSIISGYDLSFYPQKGNNIRYVTLDSRFDSFISAVSGQYEPFIGRTQSMLYNIYNVVKLWDTFQVSGSYRTFYIFRYRKVKQMYEDGYSISDIATYMGYTSTDTPLAYLNAVVFLNFTPPPVEVVEIGGQIWMKNNLDIDDGLGGIYDYDNTPANSFLFGKLYTYDAAMRISNNITGFHMPTKDEVLTLINYCGGLSPAGGVLKESSFSFWNSPNTGAIDTYGFSMKGGGYRNSSGTYAQLKEYNYFQCYSGTTYYQYRARYNSTSMQLLSLAKTYAFSLRMIANW
jgi:uncharacterized protein (TIGR02145 family)